MKSALLRLRESQDAMSVTERAVSDYVINHPEEAVKLSIHQLAERTFASPSTIIRMCQRMGCGGYKEFRQAVTFEVAAHRLSQDQKRRGGQTCREITGADSLDDIVDKVTYKNILSLEDTRNLIDTQVLRSCVDLLGGARTVLLFGQGASLVAVRALNVKLLRVNKPCVSNDDGHTQLLQARNATQQDLAIVVSDSGRSAEVVECMDALRANHTPIVAITRQEASPVAEKADYRLFTTDEDLPAQPGHMSARMSQLNVIDILFTAYASGRAEPQAVGMA